MRITTLSNKKGQGLVEYGIILVLVAVAAIGVFAIFGGTIKDKIAQVTAAISGDTSSYDKEKKAAKTRSEAAATQAAKKGDMKGSDQIGEEMGGASGAGGACAAARTKIRRVMWPKDGPILRPLTVKAGD